VETSVGTAVESGGTARQPGLDVRLFGGLTVRRGGIALRLPPSRKARALLGYLALIGHPIGRSQLCELLWETSDPRGELRWCLSKLRPILDEPARARLLTSSDTIALDLSDSFVDAVELGRAALDVRNLDVARMSALLASCTGELLEDLELDESPAYGAWLVAQRRRFRGQRAALLERAVEIVPEGERLAYLEQWLHLAPFDRRVHESLFNALAAQSRFGEGEEHLAQATRLFEADGLDAAPLLAAWRAARLPKERAVPATPKAERESSAADGEAGALANTPHRQASVAVMPFANSPDLGEARGGISDALAHDIITRLAKLRSLFVIAQGTTFALHERRIGAEEAGRMLDVDYVVGGSTRRTGDRLRVNVELVETRTARIVWAEVFDRTLDSTLEVLDGIGNSIVASIASEIEASERNRAVLRPPNSLDAWQAHHRGLWHMYRFNKTDNEAARQFFEMAIQLDPTFARAHAGLSFTHFQNAFQHWAPRELEIERAFESAGQSLMSDERDPAAHLAVGRALWLRGRYDQSVSELERAVDLSPNFALGHYTLAFVRSQAGDPLAAIEASDYSRQLSPFDPLLFGMLGARAMALVRLGRFDEAADWGTKAAMRPNAHAHILAIAALSLALAERDAEARTFAASIAKVVPDYGIEDFLTAMQFDGDGDRLFRAGAKRIGLGKGSA
jgi:TolB-like protein/Flp pilus assembly protein TadD